MSIEPVVTGRAPEPKTNPLAKFFRTPAIYINLPSNGAYWPSGSLDLTENSELPVFPMTNRDEITLRTPDALINGQGVVDIIQSCIPNIKDAWKMPSTDVDVCLIAIRIASYGHNMDFEQTCPSCGHEHTYGMDLRHAMSTIGYPDYDSLVEFEQINIKFRPQSYAQANKSNQAAFEMAKIQQNIDALTDEESRALASASQLEKLTELSAKTMADVTEYIQPMGSDERIDNPEYIKEFYSNIDSKLFNTIQKALGDRTQDANIKPMKVACVSCGSEMELNIIFDYASFFAPGS